MVDSPEHKVDEYQLLVTKLYSPRWDSNLISRLRLVERMCQGIRHKLTLISAPPGFGKTTLLAEWLAAAEADGTTTAWVSLDHGDNDFTLFWTYLVTAIQNIYPSVGDSALSLLRSPQTPPIESVLTTLINEINAIEEDFVLVLDDYHEIDFSPIHNGIAFLLDHMPRQIHLIIASRSDPPLPLARLRARGELTELRAADLRFTADEAVAFLNEVMGLELSANDVAALETRTEGWIAGLQLAALSMQGRQDISTFITSFAGDDRYILDYLVEEVLQSQPEHVRSFLLQTSILERLSGPLCHAVTGQENARELLANLEQSNLFVVPLDNYRQWYRYHHLFADVLQAHASEENPDGVPELHRRASEWYEDNVLLSDAVRHALAAKDFDRAARLVESSWSTMDRNRQSATWIGWVKSLPEDVIRARPVLSVGFAWALLDVGELETSEARLRDAERWLGASADTNALSGDAVVVDDAEFSSLKATIASARAYNAQTRGDISSTIEYARQALDLIPENDVLRQGIPSAMLAMASWASGDLQSAESALIEIMSSIQKAGNFQFVISGSFALADIKREQGRLLDAFKTVQHSLNLASDQGEHIVRLTADLHTVLSELYIEHNDLQSAEQHLQKSKELAQQSELPHWNYRWCIAQARFKEIASDLNGALDMLQEAEGKYRRGPVPNSRPVAALKARVLIAQGKLAEAHHWASERRLSANDELSYLREFEHITLARLMIARHQLEGEARYLDETIGLLERLLIAAEEGGRTASVIEILLLHALAKHMQGNTSHALASLERALSLAEPEAYIRIFVNEGKAMHDLLCRSAVSSIGGSYTMRLLEAFGESGQALPSSASTSLAEPLTAREIEVLRLIAAGMRNQEIADNLFISLSTVKRHIANTYGKLGASHRTEAVARANELSLL